jgi:hypothetical protein
MFRALLALFFALLPALAWAQTAPPPDTKPARERHRIQEKEPPPPEGPWGPEQIGLTWHAPVWRGAIAAGGGYSGASLTLDLPHALAASSNGISPPVFERLTYKSENFRSITAGLAADLDMIRLSFMWFQGTFDAGTTFTRDDGVLPPQSRDVPIHGVARGFRVGAYWPAFRYRDTLFEASLGPATTVGWMHQETTQIPGEFLTRDTVDVLTGSFGPKISLRLFPVGSWEMEVDAEYAFMTGGIRGWTKEYTAGIGTKF